MKLILKLNLNFHLNFLDKIISLEKFKTINMLLMRIIVKTVTQTKIVGINVDH
jgi:hypothetical protein